MGLWLIEVAKAAAAGVVVTVLVLGVACSSDESENGSKSEGSGRTGAVDATGAITILAKDNVYDPKNFTGPGSQTITLTLDNKGAAIHNFVIKDQKGPDGKELQTSLLPANQSEKLEFTLPAGSYDFYCSVHPIEMRGKMTLS